MTTAEVNVFRDAEEVGQEVTSYLEQIAEMTIMQKGKFVVGFSGGSVANILCEHLPNITTEWDKWYVFLCDERVVSKDDPDCIYTVYKEGLLSKVGIPEENLFGIADESAPLEDIVEAYAKSLAEVQDGGAPDVVVLGMGPDGHTASLFPDHDSLDADTAIVGETDSPKSPSTRISMTLKTLNASSSAIFVSCGEGKAETVSSVLSEEPDFSLPAARVNPKTGLLSWYLDLSAAKLLKPPVISPHQQRSIEAAFTFKEML